VHSWEELASPQLERFRQAPCGQGILERPEIAPEVLRIDRHCFSAIGDEHFGAESLAQVRQLLPQCAPSVGIVQLGPEQGDEGVTTVQLGRVGRTEVGEKSEPLRAT
jgi:hypothetical protein